MLLAADMSPYDSSLNIANRPALRHYVDQQRRKYPLPFLIKILRGRMFNRGMHVWSILGDRAMQWRRAGLPGDDFFGGLYGKECAARIAAEDKQQPAQHDSTVSWSSVNRWWRSHRPFVQLQSFRTALAPPARRQAATRSGQRHGGGSEMSDTESGARGVPPDDVTCGARPAGRGERNGGFGRTAGENAAAASCSWARCALP